MEFNFARRYLVGRKSHTLINLLSWISGLAVAVPAMAMVVIMSLQNGLSDSVVQMYVDFDSELNITAMRGRSFDSEPVMRKLTDITAVECASGTLQENVLLRYNDREQIATLRGVDTLYDSVTGIRSRMIVGDYILRWGELEKAVLGQGIAYNLGFNFGSTPSIEIYSIKPGLSSSVFPSQFYRQGEIQPAGIYSLDEQTDSRYVFVGIDFLRDFLMQDSADVSSVELKLRDGADVKSVQQEIKILLGADFLVRTRYEQKELLYRVVNQEKWVVFVLLIAVLAIATLSLAGNILVLVAEKSADIESLRFLGATTGFLRRIFVYEGVMIVILGASVGIISGIVFSLLQQQYGFLRIDAATALIESYPIRVSVADILIIFVGVIFVGSLITMITTRCVIKK